MPVLPTPTLATTSLKRSKTWARCWQVLLQSYKYHFEFVCTFLCTHSLNKYAEGHITRREKSEWIVFTNDYITKQRQDRSQIPKTRKKQEIERSKTRKRMTHHARPRPHPAFQAVRPTGSIPGLFKRDLVNLRASFYKFANHFIAATPYGMAMSVAASQADI
ncbi:hypothetical protein CPC08DRAFT_747276 [Agrocybe pediades]|nr:hypothetical protein CPC08DRAFT_747276 [Agrocybe pediades]